ncbi:MAG: glycosyltransferase [Rhodospirillaceae bacterium]|nr:glycosyltransferase [Rhodospirillaceae bacterium]
MSGRPLLLIMTKQPQLGAVKRRLAKGIGEVAAWQFYRRNVFDLLKRLTRVPFWRTQILITPDRARYGWPKGLRQTPQGHGDLGARMLTGLNSAPRGAPTIVIGCDIPAITMTHIRNAFIALRQADAVFGPAEDGGYWLVGFSGRRRFWRPFANVRWSSPHALADTTKNLLGSKISYAARLRDVDDVKSLVLAKGAL